MPWLCGCDEGRIEEDLAVGAAEGRTVRLEAELHGLATWPDGYSVVVAGFSPGGAYAEISKPVASSTDSDGRCVFEMGGVGSDVTVVELCAIDRLRRRVATFVSVDADGTGTISLDPGVVDVSMYAAVQTEVFDTRCVQCHGRTGHAAASLRLTADASHADLVGVSSVKEPDLLRVDACSSGTSLLYRALTTDMTRTWGYDHSVEVVDDVLTALLRDWIDTGAADKSLTDN